MAVKKITCDVCSINNGASYKCPTCRVYYCSVNCCKAHKLVCTAQQRMESIDDSPPAGSVNVTRYYHETEDTISVQELERLKHSKTIKEMLENPHLRKILGCIDQSQNAANLLEGAMKEPIFLELVDECLKIVT